MQLFDLKNYIDRQLIASPDSIFVAFAVGIFAIAAISVPFGLVSEIADIIGSYQLSIYLNQRKILVVIMDKLFHDFKGFSYHFRSRKDIYCCTYKEFTNTKYVLY